MMSSRASEELSRIAGLLRDGTLRPSDHRMQLIPESSSSSSCSVQPRNSETSSRDQQAEMDSQVTAASSPPVQRPAKRPTPDMSDVDQDDENDAETETDEDFESSLPPLLTEQTRRAQYRIAQNISVDLSEDEIVSRVLELVFPEHDPNTADKLRRYRFDIPTAVRMTVRKLTSAR
eukprot:233613-Hanusia_phi.AAC.1